MRRQSDSPSSFSWQMYDSGESYKSTDWTQKYTSSRPRSHSADQTTTTSYICLVGCVQSQSVVQPCSLGGGLAWLSWVWRSCSGLGKGGVVALLRNLCLKEASGYAALVSFGTTLKFCLSLLHLQAKWIWFSQIQMWKDIRLSWQMSFFPLTWSTINPSRLFCARCWDSEMSAFSWI